MCQHHKAGEKLFVDYCGLTMDIVNPRMDEVRTVQVFGRLLFSEQSQPNGAV
jgi:hypothetical protein